ncbi:facilitated trehalose transporter Tret1-like [Aphis craccivora]|uniref:Facilitated trehalose transporter Tret1-like n=1 Tax=Aphis craccivora TaxID=307492 RepID=A0A6G0YZT6_APHCR|nr:facilitated trehalose transporter Tret1-like [Aphis craccivora]
MGQFPLPHAVTDIQCGNELEYNDLVEIKVKYGKRATIAQLLATIVQSLLLVNVGMELAMATVVIGSLYKNPNAEFHLSDNESSWYGSILYLCQPIGSCLSGYAQKRFGKKSCVVLACVPSIFGWMLLWYANSVTMLYWSTITMGMGLGFTDGPAYSYIGEICEPRLRGIMSCVINMACLIGVLSSYGLSYVFQWKTVAAVSALCPVLCLTLVTFIPESPIWLLSKGKNEKAMKAICWLRGWVDPHVAANEYQDLMFYYKASLDKSKTIRESKGTFSSFLWIKSPSVYRPLRLVTIYYIFTLISCLTPCRPYIVKLMYESGVKDTHSIALVLYGFMQLAGSIGLTLTVRKIGKRMLTLSTLGINTLAIFLFAVYFVCIKNKLISSEAYVPMILYSIIMFSGAMGMLTVPWTLVSEIYPNEAKGFASSLTTAIFYVLTFSATKIYLSVETTLGLNNTFFMMAGSSFVGFVYLYRNMPETENKTLMEIEEFFVPQNDQTSSEVSPGPRAV